MNDINFKEMLDLEDIGYQFNKIDRLVHIIRDNYYDKNDVYYKNIEDYYDLCVTYKDVSLLLDTIQEIARTSSEKFKLIYDKIATKKEIQSQ